jgi:hypothetical protein
MPRLWGPPPMMYLPCPPWMGWYDLWTHPSMYFHPGWSGPGRGFGHRGYHAGDDYYGGVGQQQTRQENWIVQNAKLDHSVPPQSTEALGQLHKQSVRGSQDAWRSGGGQD